jgi:TonB family protein
VNRIMEKVKRFDWRRSILYAGLLGFLILPFGKTAQAEEARKIKTKVEPAYPELARRMNLKGTARVQLIVTPEGNVKEVRELGGNPVLLDALVRAVKKWKYEPANKESTIEVTYTFNPS